MFILSIETSGAAFTIESNGDDNGTPAPGPELSRLLRRVADDIETGAEIGTVRNIRDVNGHRVGEWRLTDDY